MGGCASTARLAAVSDAVEVSATEQALGAAEGKSCGSPMSEARNTQHSTTAWRDRISSVDVSTSKSSQAEAAHPAGASALPAPGRRSMTTSGKFPAGGGGMGSGELDPHFSRSKSIFSNVREQLLDVVPAPEAGQVDFNKKSNIFSTSVRTIRGDDVARATTLAGFVEIVQEPSAISSPGEGDNACRICGIIKFYQSAAQEECGSRGKCATCCNCSRTEGLWSKADFHAKSCEQCRARRISKNARELAVCRVLTQDNRSSSTVNSDLPAN
jgi:hypothetical protein